MELRYLQLLSPSKTGVMTFEKVSLALAINIDVMCTRTSVKCMFGPHAFMKVNLLLLLRLHFAIGSLAALRVKCTHILSVFVDKV